MEIKHSNQRALSAVSYMLEYIILNKFISYIYNKLKSSTGNGGIMVEKQSNERTLEILEKYGYGGITKVIEETEPKIGKGKIVYGDNALTLK